MVIKKYYKIVALYILVSVLQLFNPCFSQKKTALIHDLNWFEPRTDINFDQNNPSFFGFKNAIYSYDNQKITGIFTNSLDWEKGFEPEFKIVNVLTESLKNEEVNLIDINQVYNEIKINYEISVSRGKVFLIYSFVPFIKNSAGEIEKVLSIEIEIEKKTAPVLKQNLRMAFAGNSVLNNGDWYKVGVIADGIYKISYSQLQSMGISIDEISPDAINIFGNSFGMLPEVNNIDRPDDLLKNAIYIEGGSDGSFDPADYILFFARGADSWTKNGNYFDHKRHQYSDTSYYFIQIDTANISPKRISAAVLSSGSPTHQVTTFNDYKIIQNDNVNLMKSGREWLGEHFDIVTEYSYAFSFLNIDNTSQARLRAAIAAKTPGTASSNFDISIPEISFSSNFSVSGVGSGGYPYNAVYANGGVLTYYLNSPASLMTVNLNFNRYSASSEGWTDYLEMNARRNLIFTGNFMEFKDIVSEGIGNISEFTLTSNNTQVIIWEITDPSGITQINPVINGNNYSFSLETDTLRSFAAFTHAGCSAPQYFGKVANQDLHGMNYADLLIVTHPDFYSQASDLKTFHESEGLTVNLVTTQQVYNEFSSGMKDVTAIRMFFKMFYDRAGGDTTLMPRYAVLVGDGSYDNKYRLPGNTAFIPTYQSASYGQLYIISSYTSDDYFAMLDDNEGMSGGNLMDIAVGRLCVKNNSEATGVVEKIIAYSTEVAPPLTEGCCDTEIKPTLNDWRNWITIVADDEDYNAYIDAGEDFSDYIEANHPDYLIKKIFLDSYLQSSTPGGKRYYEAEEDLRERVQSGSLFVNYIGHGGEVGWAHERILDLTTINGWTNSPRLPLFMTATCEFSRYDDPARTSAGEYLLINNEGGAIALMTTTRLVISGPNEQLNGFLIEYFLDRGFQNGRQQIGDLYLDSKNKMAFISPSNSINTRNFTLLGDPAVKFKIPFHKIVTDSLNGIEVSGSIDTLKALSVITISGHVEDESGNFLNNFNGIVTPVVFDKDQTVNTLLNDQYSYAKSFNVTKNIIYKGKATVTNGRFSYSFVVPKDISFQYGNGKLSFYAHNYSTDANGYNNSVIVGGANTNAPADNTGPDMDIYLNDESFVDGGITDSKPFLIVKASDENGLNTVGNGIGHDLTAVLDENTVNTIILNEYYEADLDTYKSGKIKYQLGDLEPGEHTIKVKIWDVYNNSSEKELSFVVAEESEMALKHVLNYPNPFTTNTVFMLEHNQVCQSVEVKISIMTITGKIVKTIRQVVNAEGFRIDPIEWDGLDEFGDKLAIGTYIYRVEVTAGDKKADQYEKLVILR